MPQAAAAIRTYQRYRCTIVTIANGAQPHIRRSGALMAAAERANREVDLLQAPRRRDGRRRCAAGGG